MAKVGEVRGAAGGDGRKEGRAEGRSEGLAKGRPEERQEKAAGAGRGAGMKAENSLARWHRIKPRPTSLNVIVLRQRQTNDIDIPA
jgi:hypothetical protein